MANLFYYNKEKSGYCVQEKTNSIYECIFCAEVCETGIILRNTPQARINTIDTFSIVQTPFRETGYDLNSTGYYSSSKPSYGHVAPPVLQLDIESMPSREFCTDCEENVGTYSGWYDGIYWNFPLCSQNKKQSGCNIFMARAVLGFNSGETFNYNDGETRNVYLFLHILAAPFTDQAELSFYEKSSSEYTNVPLLTIATKSAIVGTMKYSTGVESDYIPYNSKLSNQNNPIVRNGFYNSTVYCTGWKDLELNVVSYDNDWGCDISNSIFKITSVNDTENIKLLPYLLDEDIYRNTWKGCAYKEYSSKFSDPIDPSGIESIIFRETIDGIDYRSIATPVTQEIEFIGGSGEFWDELSGIHSVFYHPRKNDLTLNLARFNFTETPSVSETINNGLHTFNIYPFRYLKIMQDYSFPNEDQRIDPLLCNKFRSPVAASSHLDISCFALSIYNFNNISQSGHALLDVIGTYDFQNNQVFPRDLDLSDLVYSDPTFYSNVDKNKWLFIRYSGNYDINHLNGKQYFDYDLELRPIFINNEKTNNRLFLDNTTLKIKEKHQSNNIFSPCLEKNTSKLCEGAKLPDYLTVDFSSVEFDDGLVQDAVFDNPAILFYKGFYDNTTTRKYSLSSFTYTDYLGNPGIPSTPVYHGCNNCETLSTWQLELPSRNFVNCSTISNTKPNGSYILNKGFWLASEGVAPLYGFNGCLIESQCTSILTSGTPYYYYENPDYNTSCDWKYILCTIRQDSNATSNVLLNVIYPELNKIPECGSDSNNICDIGSDIVYFSGQFTNLNTFNNQTENFIYKDCSQPIILYYTNKDVGIVRDHDSGGPLCTGIIYTSNFTPDLVNCGFIFNDIESVGGAFGTHDKILITCEDIDIGNHPVYINGNVTLTPYYN